MAAWPESQDRPMAAWRVAPPTRLEREILEKIPRLAGGDVGQRLWERGHDASWLFFFSSFFFFRSLVYSMGG